MKRDRAALAGCAITLVASVALARIHPFGDAGLFLAKGAEPSILTNAQAPAQVRAILIEKCADCHSNQPRARFYGHFAPASWLMERDIAEARKAMNLSLWDTYPADRRQTLAAKIVQEAKSHQMPPLQYRAIHWNAGVGDADVKSLGDWAHAVQQAGAGGGMAGEGDPVRGKALFEKRCTGCHALTVNREGPNLRGVYGRAAGTADGFAYSAALKKAKIVWDDNSLTRWLADPDAFLPGNDMDYLVVKAQERLDLVSYLKQASGR